MQGVGGLGGSLQIDNKYTVLSAISFLCGNDKHNGKAGKYRFSIVLQQLYMQIAP